MSVSSPCIINGIERNHIYRSKSATRFIEGSMSLPVEVEIDIFFLGLAGIVVLSDSQWDYWRLA